MNLSSNNSMTKLVVFVVFVSNLHPIRTECRGKADCIAAGYYRLCDSCTRFFRCVYDASTNQYTMFMLTCPTGTVWDETVDVCRPSTPDQNVCAASSSCGTLPTVEHGVFADQGDQTAVLQCDEGYHVRADFVTPGSITCTDGQWEDVNTANLCIVNSP